MLDRESAKTTQLDPVTARQSGDNLVQNRIHDILDVPLIEMRIVFGDALNKLRLDHRGACL
jgi:hypothetical protein